MGKPRGKAFQPGQSGNPGGRRKSVPEVLANDMPELPEGVSEGEKQVLRELWRWGKSGRQGSGMALRSFYELGFGKARQKPEAPSGPQVGDETMRRCADLIPDILDADVKDQVIIALLEEKSVDGRREWRRKNSEWSRASHFAWLAGGIEEPETAEQRMRREAERAELLREQAARAKEPTRGFFRKAQEDIEAKEGDRKAREKGTPLPTI